MNCLRGFKVAMAACEKMARWQQLLTLLTEPGMVANARSPELEFLPVKAANAMREMVEYDDI